MDAVLGFPSSFLAANKKITMQLQRLLKTHWCLTSPLRLWRVFQDLDEAQLAGEWQQDSKTSEFQRLYM